MGEKYVDPGNSNYFLGVPPPGSPPGGCPPMTSAPSRSDLSVSRLRDQIQREISNLSLSSERVNAAVVEIESVLASMKDRLRAQTRQAEDLKQALATIERLA